MPEGDALEPTPSARSPDGLYDTIHPVRVRFTVVM
jgi:hypothetical protein